MVGAGQAAFDSIWYFCLQAFSPLSWYTLKASAKTSACGVRGPFSNRLSLAFFVTVALGEEKKCSPEVAYLLGFQGPD